MANRLIDDNTLMAEYNYAKNKEFDLNTLTLGSEKKIWWICKYGHEWESNIYNRAHGKNGCPTCANRIVLEGVNDLNTKFPDIAKQWNYEKNGDLKPTQVTYGSGKKVWWTCPVCNNDYIASVYSRYNGTNCPYCTNKILINGTNDLVTTNPDLAKEWNFKKNNKKPTEVVAGSRSIVWWICEKNDSYSSRLVDKKNCGRCPYCCNQKVLTGYNDLATTSPSLAKEWNYKKNLISHQTMSLLVVRKKYGGYVLNVVMNGKHKLLIEIMEQIVQNVEKKMVKVHKVHNHLFFIIIIFTTCNSIKSFFTNNLIII